MKKFNKATAAAIVGALTVIIEWASDISIPAAVQGAVVTIVVFLVPNSDV